MSTHLTGVPLADAERVAWELIERLKPCCRQIMLCGSIRRRRPTVNDIDIVVEPLTETRPGLLPGDEQTVCRVHQWAARMAESGRARMDANGPKVIRISYLGEVLGRGLVRIGLDLYLADAARFPMTAMVRTGSEQHNRTLADRCIERGLRLQVTEGRIVHDCRDMALARPVELDLPEWPTGVRTQYDYERAVYLALGLDWLPPDQRDPGMGNWVLHYD